MNNTISPLSFAALAVLLLSLVGCDGPEKPSKMVEMRSKMEEQRKQMGNGQMMKGGPGAPATKTTP
jgi:hypothetical protein